MKVLVAFLFIAFFIGGTNAGAWVRDRPKILLSFAVVTAASYWSLGVVLG
jgi:hypothetical protein